MAQAPKTSKGNTLPVGIKAPTTPLNDNNQSSLGGRIQGTRWQDRGDRVGQDFNPRCQVVECNGEQKIADKIIATFQSRLLIEVFGDGGADICHSDLRTIGKRAAAGKGYTYFWRTERSVLPVFVLWWVLENCGQRHLWKVQYFECGADVVDVTEVHM